MRHVIAYDVRSDARRAAIARTLEGYGRRVQYSVFECELNAGDLASLVGALDALVHAATDRVRIYRLCAMCAGEAESLGMVVHPFDPDVWIV